MSTEERVELLERLYPELEIIVLKEKVEIFNEKFNTIVQITLDKFNKLSDREIFNITHSGKNIEHITRVTGYFSKVGYWNKGKKQEFIDRYRNKKEEFNEDKT